MCSIDYDDHDDAPSVWRNTDRRARKPHVCATCHRRIERGEAYRVHASILDGHATTEKACADCTAVIDDFGRDHHACFAPSSIINGLEQCVEEQEAGWERWGAAYAAIMARRNGPFAARNLAAAYHPHRSEP